MDVKNWEHLHQTKYIYIAYKPYRVIFALFWFIYFDFCVVLFIFAAVYMTFQIKQNK